MNKLGAIRQAQKVLNNRSTMSKTDVLHLINRITADSTDLAKEDGAKLLRLNVRLFGSSEFSSIVSKYIERTGFKPRN